MKCPFSRVVGLFKSTPEDCPAHRTTEPSNGELSRRSLMGFGALTAGGLLLATVPGCASEEEDGDDGANAVSSGESFLALYDAIPAKYPAQSGETADDAKARFTKIIGERGALVGLWVKSKNEKLFAELRDNRPVLVTAAPDGSATPVPTLVALYDDVTTVMRDRDTFPVLAYQREMTKVVDHFILEEADNARHDREKGAFIEAMIDPEEFRASIRQAVQDLVDAAKKKTPGKIDVVRDVARWVPIKVLENYFGIPTRESAPDWLKTALGESNLLTEQDLYQHIANGFENFFLNLNPNPAVQAAGTQSSQTLLAYLTSVIDARIKNAPPTSSKDLVGRFIQLQSKYPDVFTLTSPVAGTSGPRYSGIAAHIFGIIIGAVVGVEKAAANIIDVLLDEEIASSDGFKDAVAAAKDDKDTKGSKLWQYGLEALRFKPQGFAVVRVSVKPITLAGTAIPVKSVVIASHASAMMTDRVFPKPNTFNPDRPESKYLHFGGSHFECLGKDLARIELTEILRGVLRLDNLRRESGSKLDYQDKPFPQTFVLYYDK